MRWMFWVVVSSAATAWATPTFPSVVASAVGAPAAPECSLCHANGVTSRGTVTTRVGQALRGKGLAAYDEASLRSALAALEETGVDSDGDGTADVVELRAGTNPNVASTTPKPSTDGGVVTTPEPETGVEPVPSYGCASSGVSAVELLALGCVAVALRRVFARGRSSATG